MWLLLASGSTSAWSGLPLRSVTANSRSSSSTCPSPLWSKSAKSSTSSMRPSLEDAQVEKRVDALPLAAGAHAVRAADQADGVGELKPLLRGALRNAEGRSVLDAGERQLRPGRDRVDGVVERAERHGRRVDERRPDHPRPRAHDRVVGVPAALALRRRADRAIERARPGVGRPARPRSGSSARQRRSAASRRGPSRASRRAERGRRSAGSCASATSRVPTSTAPS